MLATSIAPSIPIRPPVEGWYAVPEPLERQVITIGGAPRHVERLPFTVRVAQTPEDMRKVVQVRHASYARHLPLRMADAFRQLEPLDAVDGVVSLIAESKVDGSPLATLRVQTNKVQPLLLEQSTDLPDWMQGLRLGEVTRLAVAHSAQSRVVKTVLLKAAYFWALENGVRYMLVAGRAPLDRQYARLMFRDLYPGQGFIPLVHAFNLPHRVMYTEIAAAREQGRDHPLYDFWFNTDHPDIELD